MAAPVEKLTQSLQENVITVLAYSKDQGKIVASLINPNELDGDYRIIAEAAIGYWEKYGKPPADHLSDELDHIISDPKNRKAKSITRILRAMLDFSQTMNVEYITTKLAQLHRMQAVKSAIIESAEKLNSQQHLALPEIEQTWHELLMQNTALTSFDVGTRAGDYLKVLNSLTAIDREFRNGIHALDSRHIVPARKTLFMWLGASGRGKTWALIQQGAEALMDGKKVLHVTLEMDEPHVAQRYYQKLFSASARKLPPDAETLTLKRDSGRKGRPGNLTDLEWSKIRASFSLDAYHKNDEVKAHLLQLGGRIDNLIIKSFPSGTLTMGALHAYLDMLEMSENFIPDLLIVDYVGIFKTDPRDVRGSLSAVVVGLRGMAQARNMAVNSAHQIGRLGAKAKMAKATDIAEAWAIVFHADNIVTFSSSDREFRGGLARAFVDKGRSEKDKFAFLMTQNFTLGQFCTDSMFLSARYYELLEDVQWPEGEDGETDAA
jgi:hypothetical protein